MPNQIDHDDMRGLIRNLKNGHAIWYSPDQDFGLKQGVMAPFFGTPAATVTAHRRLMKISKAAAIPLYFYREGDISNPRYRVLISPALEHFQVKMKLPMRLASIKLLKANSVLLRLRSMWFHRRFKTAHKASIKFTEFNSPNN